MGSVSIVLHRNYPFQEGIWCYIKAINHLLVRDISHNLSLSHRRCRAKLIRNCGSVRGQPNASIYFLTEEEQDSTS